MSGIIIQRDNDMHRRMPPFLNKLLSMVENESNDNLLNIYGFRKVPHLQQGGLISEGPRAESWEFRNKHFRRSQLKLLDLIRRKKGTRGAADEEAQLPHAKWQRLNDDSSVARKVSSNGAPTLRRKVSSLPVIASKHALPQFNNTAVGNTPVPVAGTLIGMQSRFVEQVKQDINFFKFSLEDVIRQLQSAVNRDSTPDPALPA
ncbi:Heat shock transcription factor [Coemansia aciculifera]|nr:Heat shock transcription factor [Coemansia aciculifera]